MIPSKSGLYSLSRGEAMPVIDHSKLCRSKFYSTGSAILCHCQLDCQLDSDILCFAWNLDLKFTAAWKDGPEYGSEISFQRKSLPSQKQVLSLYYTASSLVLFSIMLNATTWSCKYNWCSGQGLGCYLLKGPSTTSWVNLMNLKTIDRQFVFDIRRIEQPRRGNWQSDVGTFQMGILFVLFPVTV